MRVADKMNYNQVQRTLNDNREQMSNLQNQAATGKRLQKPSDDPVSATRVLAGRTNLSQSEQFIKNNENAQNFMNFTDSALEELTNVFIRAKELALNQANDASSGPESKEIVAKEVQQLFDQSIMIGNRRFGDRHIFAGFKTTQSPFDFNGKYNGDDGDMLMEINKGSYIPMNVSGSKIFLGKNFQVEPIKGQAALEDFPITDYQNLEKTPEEQRPVEGPVIRGPASNLTEVTKQDPDHFGQGINILKVLGDLRISLEAGDKRGIQQSIEDLDIAREQVVAIRAQMGARMNTVTTTLESLQKTRMDNKSIISQHEDADAFQVYSDLKKVEGNLEASLKTSERLSSRVYLTFLSKKNI